MFAGVIGRWVALAALSDNILVRQGGHTRASEWPEHLVHAENDRTLFDTKLCWTVASHICDYEERALAFAMGTHSRLGDLSPALSLVGDLVRQISRSELIPTVDSLYRRFLCEKALMCESHKLVFRGTALSTQMPEPLLIRRLLQSEKEDRAMYKWSARHSIFFCKRGWFAGVHPINAPVEVRHAPAAMQQGEVIVGLFESIPHVFCGVWFPVCRPFAICMHLLHAQFDAVPV